MSQQESVAPLPPTCPQSDDPSAWQAYSDQWSAYAEYFKNRIHDIKQTEAWRDYWNNWRIYWQRCGQFWRTEPEIDRQRKEELAQRLNIVPNIAEGIYPFKGMKLARADIEWLLVTHEIGGLHGPVDRTDANKREREGLDLRGADLRGAELSHLPLAHLRGGLDWPEWHSVLPLARTMAAVQMGSANLNHALMERAILMNAQLEGADLSHAQMEGTNLAYAQLKEANLSGAQTEGANLAYAQLKEANLSGARMKSANFPEAFLKEANFSNAELEGVNFSKALMEGANLSEAQLKGADLSEVQLKGANLNKAYLEEANFSEAQLEGAKLARVNLVGKRRIGPRLADVQWGNTNLSVVKWSQMEMLGDEYLAYQKKKAGEVKDKDVQLRELYESAVRANRQLAVALQTQGLNEESVRFAYRAQILQRVIYRLQRKFGKYLFSVLLGALAGYGYKPGFTVIWYLGTLLVFALLYLHFGHVDILGAVILSLTSFHGRGFFPSSTIIPENPMLIGTLAAFEAVIGLFIEISFIATFTQRFLSK